MRLTDTAQSVRFAVDRSANGMDRVTTIGVDIGKNTFHPIGLDSAGSLVLRQKIFLCHAQVPLDGDRR